MGHIIAYESITQFKSYFYPLKYYEVLCHFSVSFMTVAPGTFVMLYRFRRTALRAAAIVVEYPLDLNSPANWEG